MDGLLFAIAFFAALAIFGLVALSRSPHGRDAIDGLEGRTLPLAPWTHHD